VTKEEIFRRYPLCSDLRNICGLEHKARRTELWRTVCMLDRGHVGGVHVAYHLDGRICRVWNDAGEEIEVED
jgi:hypothetical protein